MTAPLRMQELARWYGQVLGVSNITADVGSGVTGLLGMNGAGKTTLLNLLAGHLFPHSGRVWVCGQQVAGNWRVYRDLGFCPDLEGGFGSLSGQAFLAHHLRVKGYSRRQARDRAEDLLAENGLGDAAYRRVKGYSRGMKQRLKLAFAIAHDPQVVLLDEPLSGLDPPGRAMMIARIRQWGEDGRTVLVSSHILPEVESLTRRVLLIHRGRLLAEGDVGEIREQMNEVPRTVLIESTEHLKVRQALAGMECVLSLHDGEMRGVLKVETSPLSQFMAEINRRVAEEGWNLRRLTCPDEKLEAVFNDLLELKGGGRGG